MPKDHESQGNVLIEPAEIASRLESIDPQQHEAESRRIEEHLAHRLRLGGAITYIDVNGHHVIEDKNGTRPFAAGDKFPSPPNNAEFEIRELAFLHGVHGVRSDLDEWTEAVSSNAGDEVISDEIELLVIGLRRIEAVDGIALTKLHARYLEEVFNS
ncbi:hypothetical protein [Ahrensia sp. 13_GOM-1096m]|uniref:hypothetical protein n=1 Tax=Ahrensia sp. 13_GOM-1096m TaxID=1380380 RepID=UPI0012DE3A7A|nr:hypothetical protein [Ahrensia sp. 13_GOM-1096m]